MIAQKIGDETHRLGLAEWPRFIVGIIWSYHQSSMYGFPKYGAIDLAASHTTKHTNLRYAMCCTEYHM